LSGPALKKCQSGAAKRSARFCKKVSTALQKGQHDAAKRSARRCQKGQLSADHMSALS